LWNCLLMLYVVAGAPITPFHGDEATQIYMSRDYAYQFIERKLDLVTFHEPPISAQEQHLRLLNGTINKYLIGLAWHAGGFALADINEQWDWGGSWEYNHSTNHAPRPELLDAARLPSALLLALGVPVMFALGWLTGDSMGAWTAGAASLLYALHPALLVNGRRAMMEGSLTFFTLLTVLAGVWWIKRRSWGAALALGLAAGLTVASKHTGVFTLIAVGVGVSLRGREVGVRGWLMLLFAAGIAALTFYALNPAWWSDPISRAGDVLRLRQDLLRGQTDAFGGYANTGDALAGFWRQTFTAAPQYYEISAWGDYIGGAIRAYEASIWRGVGVGAALLAPLTVIGAIFLLRVTERPLRLLIGMWALVTLLSALLLTPLEWQRYYLPVYPPLLLLAALGIAGLFTALRWLRRDASARFSR
jgi:4-amino-4-deoxy-L-arabinose transferase-like glycosyltransferase